MRLFALFAFLISFLPTAWAQVDVDSTNDAQVGAPARYRLDPNVNDSNTAEVGRPYYYGPYGYPYGYYRGVQAVPDANDPNYFPPDAALGAKQNPAPAKKSAPPKANVQTMPNY